MINMSINEDNEGRIRFYTPDLSEFDLYAKALADTATVRRGAWFDFDHDQAADLAHACLYAYCVINDHRYRTLAGRIDTVYSWVL